MSTTYEYLTLELARGRASWPALATHMRETARTKIASDGGELLGLFSPQLGFASNEGTVLVRWPDTAGNSSDAFGIPGTKVVLREILAPTLRPRDGDKPKAGVGIYVHRWFTIDGDKAAEFVDLSNRAWGGFEGTYDTEIFGLFAAAAADEDLMNGAARLLLLTWYRDHGVWEASREQAADAQSLFAQRHLLTRTTIGRSSLLVV